ncbi:MAG: flagellar export chaperone FliS [Actinomycetota bacterium]|nr:flagellar export chaperone FliS [Actinomycetota bacterium]
MSTYAPSRSTTAYREASILTAPPERLVVMLYDGARRFLYQAALAMREERNTEADERLRRAEMIVEELLATLNLEAGGEIASNLQGLYVFFLRQLSEGRGERDAGKLDWVNAQLSELRESWAQIGAAAS